ncbi:MAG: hypothetical protein ISS95_00205 [Candidatus Aenigmarchaeota archaeon]|nr:hypothetical protein [Candidatus Aenigmarchaeota archaeon]
MTKKYTAFNEIKDVTGIKKLGETPISPKAAYLFKRYCKRITEKSEYLFLEETEEGLPSMDEINKAETAMKKNRNKRGRTVLDGCPDLDSVTALASYDKGPEQYKEMPSGRDFKEAEKTINGKPKNGNSKEIDGLFEI